MNILVIGGSRNIGYYSALRFLETGNVVTLLLRNTSVFDDDVQIQTFVHSKKVHLVKGDALIKEDVQRAWDSAASNSESGFVDLLLFTVGGIPKFNFSKGFVLSPPNLVTKCLFNALSTLPTPNTRIITITSVGLTRTSHASLPLPLKPMYSYLLGPPHRDKIGTERLIAHCAGWEWNTKEDGEIPQEILADGWMETEGLPASGTVKNVLVIRPALFTDGECLAEKPGGKKYRVSEGELGGWTVSRRDVAHFVVDAVVNRWAEFSGKKVNIAY